MEKPLFAFSARAVVALAAALVSLHAAHAQVATDRDGGTNVSKRPSELFGKLPSSEVQWVGTPPPEIAVGDVLKLRIGISSSVNGRDQYRLIVPPDVKSLLEEGWYISERIEITHDGLLIEAVPLSSGRLSLPSLLIVGPDGEPMGRTGSFTVDVKGPAMSMDPQKDQPPDFLPPVGIEFPIWLAVLLGLLALGAVVGVGYGVFRLIRGRRKTAKMPGVPIAPPKPAAETALEALTLLEERKLWMKGEFKTHYFAISETMKVYLGTRFGSDAVESTTSELIRSLEKTAEDSLVDRVESLFERLDRVKFSDHIPHAQESLEVIEAARAVVISTRKASLGSELIPVGISQKGGN